MTVAHEARLLGGPNEGDILGVQGLLPEIRTMTTRPAWRGWGEETYPVEALTQTHIYRPVRTVTYYEYEGTA